MSTIMESDTDANAIASRNSNGSDNGNDVTHNSSSNHNLKRKTMQDEDDAVVGQSSADTNTVANTGTGTATGADSTSPSAKYLKTDDTMTINETPTSTSTRKDRVSIKSINEYLKTNNNINNNNKNNSKQKDTKEDTESTATATRTTTTKSKPSRSNDNTNSKRDRDRDRTQQRQDHRSQQQYPMADNSNTRNRYNDFYAQDNGPGPAYHRGGGGGGQYSLPPGHPRGREGPYNNHPPSHPRDRDRWGGGPPPMHRDGPHYDYPDRGYNPRHRYDNRHNDPYWNGHGYGHHEYGRGNGPPPLDGYGRGERDTDFHHHQHRGYNNRGRPGGGPFRDDYDRERFHPHHNNNNNITNNNNNNIKSPIHKSRSRSRSYSRSPSRSRSVSSHSTHSSHSYTSSRRSRSSNHSNRRRPSPSTSPSRSRSPSPYHRTHSRSRSRSRSHSTSSSHRRRHHPHRTDSPLSYSSHSTNTSTTSNNNNNNDNPSDEQTKNQRTIFVSQLVLRANESSIQHYFHKICRIKVQDVILLRDKRTGRHKGCAYVELRKLEDVDKACALSGKVPDFQRFPILIKASEGEKNYVNTHSTTTSSTMEYNQDSNVTKHTTQSNTITAGSNHKRIESQKVYIGSLDRNVTQAQIHAIFSQFGGTLEKVLLQIDPETGISRGYAFLQYDDPKVANLAIQIMSGQSLAGRILFLSKQNEDTESQFENGFDLRNQCHYCIQSIDATWRTGWANMNTNATDIIEVTSSEFPPDAVQRVQRVHAVLLQLNGSGLAALPGLALVPGMMAQLPSLGIGSIPEVATATSIGVNLPLTSTASSSQVANVAEEAINAALGLTAHAALNTASQEPDTSMTDSNNDPKSVGGVSPPTRFILVHNMFDKDEETEEGWDEDIRLDFEEEGAKHGKILLVKVLSKEVGGKIYASFETVDGAHKCAKNLAGRWFDKRQLRVEFVSEEEFSSLP